VFTASPFDAIAKVGEEKGATAELAMEVVFGSYDTDTDHPWHRAERGELDLDTCRAEIRARGLEAGLEIDLFDMLVHMGSDGGVRPSMVEGVRRVRAGGLRTGLITNNVKELRPFWEALIPLDELFDVVIDSSLVGVRKPDPRIFALALEQLGGVAPDRSVFLDDYPGNVTAARAVGMHAILVEADPTDAIAALDALLG